MANNSINELRPVTIVNTSNKAYSWLNRTALDAKGGKVELIIDGVTYSTSIDENGGWNFVPPNGWAEGLHTVEVIVIDRATNRSKPATLILNVDATAPAQPEIWRAVDNTGSEKGNLTPGDSSDEHQPVLSGVAEPGAIVYLYDNAGTTPVGSTKADSMGAWTITPELEDGTHSLTVVAQDATKNLSEKSAAFELIINDGAVVSAQSAHADATTGTVAPVDVGTFAQNDEGITPVYLNKKTISTTAEADIGDMVQILINNEVYTVMTDGEGKWTFTSPELEDGTYFYQVRYVDRAGNWGDAVQRIVVIDAAAPEAPQIMRVIDDVGTLDYLTSNQYTNDNQPAINGVAQPGSIVYVYGADPMPIGSVQAGNDGRWSFEPTLTEDGTYVFSAAYKDRFGNMSPKSENFVLKLDTSVPETPTLDNVIDDEGASTGALSSGSRTDDKTPILSGTADANTLVRIWDGEKVIASTIADSRGRWTIELELEDGNHSLRVDSQSNGGNTSGQTEEFKLIVDSTLLPPVKIDEVVANNGDTEVVLADGDSTNDETPVLRGSGNDGEIVYVYDNDEIIASATVEGGKWEIEIPAREDGDHELSVVVEDPATGKRSDPSDPIKLVIDTIAPEKPTPPVVVDNEGDEKGIVEPGKAIDDKQPIFEGEKGEPGATVEIVIVDEEGNKTVIGTGIVDEDGNWTVKPTDPLEDGEHDIVVEITDPAGNTSEPSDPVKVIIDTKVPEPLTDVAIYDDVGPITGPIKAGDETDDTRPTLSGKGENGSTVAIYDGETLIGSVVVSNGEWQFEIPTLEQGEHNIRVQPVSASGVKGEMSEGISFVVDTTAPLAGTFDSVLSDKTGVEIPAGRYISDPTLKMTGTGNDGDIVIIFGDADRTKVIGSTTVVDGKWVLETEKLQDADYEFTASFRDAAGNQLDVETSFKVEVDTVEPGVPDLGDLFSIPELSEGLMHMSLNDIMSQGNDSLFIDNGKTQMIVSDKSGAELQLEDILPEGEDLNNWSQANGTVTVAGVEYNVYQNNGGDAEVLVQHQNQEQL